MNHPRTSPQRSDRAANVASRFSIARSAAFAATAFLLLGALWIDFSDRLLLDLVAGDLERYAALQTYKGWLFVALTTALIFIMTWRALTRQAGAQRALEHAAERYRGVIANLTVGVYHTDRQGKLLYLNDQGVRLVGRTLSEALAEGWLAAVHPDDRERVSARIAQATARGELFYEEFRFRHPDASELSVLSVGRPEHDARGTIIGYVGTLTDVTAIARMSETLRQSEANFRALVEESLTGVFVVQGLRYAYVNPRLPEILGASMAELMALPDVTALVVAEERAAAADYLRRCQAGAIASFHASFRCVRRDGGLAHVEALGVHTDWSGEPAIIGTAIDITERERAAAALRESENRFAIFMESNPAIVWIKDRDGRYLYMNAVWERLFGHAREDWIGKSAEALVTPADAERIRALDVRVLETNAPLSADVDFAMLSGGRHVWETVRFPFTTPDGATCIGCIGIDVTEQRRAEARIRELQERLQLAVVAGNIGLWEWDLRAREAFYSAECKHQLGYADDEIANAYEEWERRVHPDDLPATLESVRAAVRDPSLSYTAEYRMRHKDGGYRWLLAQGRVRVGENGNPMRILGSHTDITRIKEAEKSVSENRQRLDHLLAANPTVLYALRVEDTRYVPEWISDSVSRILGYAPAEALAPDWWATHVHPDDRERFLQRSAGLRQLEDSTDEYRFLHKDGSVVRVRDELRVLRDEDGRAVEIIGSWSDITRQHAERERMRLYGAAFENTHEGVVITDLAGTIVSVNHATTVMTGYDESELIGRNPRILKSGRHDRRDYQVMWAALTTTGSWQGEIWNRRKDGAVYPQLLTLSAVRDEHGVPRHYVGIATDISHIKEVEHQLTHLAHHDALTDLPNRLLLTSRLEHAIEHAARSGAHVGILFIDLDDFKNVNDGLGHAIGDELLMAVARRLALRVRTEDTLGRLGGDEFLVVLEKIEDVNTIAAVARALLACLERPVTLSSGHEIHVAASVGISVYPEDGASAGELLRCADTAMYRAKSALREHVCFFKPEMGLAATEHLELEAALRAGLEREELVLHYQPKFDARSGALCGAEALVRWQRGGGALESPAKFIPIAERTGLIGPIGDWVIEAACRQLRAWRDAGLPAVEVAVNVSVQQFLLVELVDVVTAALARHAVPPRQLGIEITESALMERPERAIAVLKPLKQLGISIYLDDFGTGFSNLAYLSRLPLDVLKIDQTFVAAIGQAPEADALIDSVIALAHGIRLRIVAEGVESQAQLDYLKAHGCDQLQGYYFGKPVPAEAFERYLSRPAAARAE